MWYLEVKSEDQHIEDLNPILYGLNNYQQEEEHAVLCVYGESDGQNL